jgi:hypothetical protein
MTKKFLLRDLDSMDDMLDQHFSDDRAVKNGISHLGQKRSEQAKQNLRDGIKKREKNGWKQSVIESSVTNTESWKQAHQRGIIKRSENQDWKNKVIENSKKSRSQESIQKYQETINKRKQDPAWQTKCIEQGSKRKKPLMTPDGIFDSRREAAKHFHYGENWVSTQMKKYPDQYYYLDPK